MRFAIVLLGLFVLAVGVRAAAWWQLRGDAQFNQLVGDAARYDQWARDIAAGDVLSRREGVFYQAPLYPYFLAGHYALFGERAVNAVRVTQVLAGALGAVMLALPARRLAGAWAGAAAGLLLALQPSAIFFDLQIEKSSLDGVLMSGLLLAIAGMIDRPSWHRFAAAGAVLGVMSLSRENAMALLIVLLPLAWLVGRGAQQASRPRASLLFPLLVGATFAAVIAPVALRNRLIGGEWHLTTSQFGPNFYIGNHARADGVYRPLLAGRGDPQFERSDATRLAESAEGRALSPRQVSRYWTRRTLAEITDDPARFLVRLIRKWVLLFHSAEIADNNDFDSAAVASSVLRMLFVPLNFGVISALAAAGFVAAWLTGNLRRLWPIVAIIAVMSASAALFYVFARYRFPLVHPLILLGATGLAGLRETDRTGNRSAVDRFALGISLLAAAAVLWTCLSPRVLPLRVRGAGAYNRAVAYERSSDFSSAERLYRRAIAINPMLVEARNNLGLLLAARGQYDAAIEQYKTVLLHHPRDAFAHNNLGMAYGGRGDLPRAIEHFERALQLDPSLAQARENLERAQNMLIDQRQR